MIINILDEGSPSQTGSQSHNDSSSRTDSPSNKFGPISMMEISPNGEYLVTYSEKDKTIVGWHVKNTAKGKKCEQDKHVKVEDKISHMCVSNKSDETILAYIIDHRIGRCYNF